MRYTETETETEHGNEKKAKILPGGIPSYSDSDRRRAHRASMHRAPHHAPRAKKKFRDRHFLLDTGSRCLYLHSHDDGKRGNRLFFAAVIFWLTTGSVVCILAARRC